MTETETEDRHEDKGRGSRRRRPETVTIASVGALLTSITSVFVSAGGLQKGDANAARLETKLDGAAREIAEFKGDVKVQIARLEGQIAAAADLKSVVARLEDRLHKLETDRR